MNEEQLRKINEQLKQSAYERQQRRQLDQQRQRQLTEQQHQRDIQQQQYWLQQLKEFKQQNREAQAGMCEWCGEEKEQLIPLKSLDNPMTKNMCTQCVEKVTLLRARASRHKEQRGQQGEE